MMETGTLLADYIFPPTLSTSQNYFAQFNMEHFTVGNIFPYFATFTFKYLRH